MMNASRFGVPDSVSPRVVSEAQIQLPRGAINLARFRSRSHSMFHGPKGVRDFEILRFHHQKLGHCSNFVYRELAVGASSYGIQQIP